MFGVIPGSNVKELTRCSFHQKGGAVSVQQRWTGSFLPSSECDTRGPSLASRVPSLFGGALSFTQVTSHTFSLRVCVFSPRGHGSFFSV